jgi:hypothetical protein
VRGGTWTHDLGLNAQIGLVAMGGTGFMADFDYVRVYHLERSQAAGAITEKPSSAAMLVNCCFGYQVESQ